MNELKIFLKSSKTKAHDDSHRLKILKAVTTYDSQVDQMKTFQFNDWESARKYAASIKEEVLDQWPDLLEEFEEKITRRGAKVWWARDQKEALRYFKEIVDQHKAKKIVKSVI